ncbi:MAG: CZB domain-containing protein [Deinococcales bacterium]
MRLIDWLKKVLAGEKPDPNFKLDQEQKFIHGLDVMAALEAHLKWRSRLEQYILGNHSEKLDYKVVSQDNICVLGQWLYGPAYQIFMYVPEYAALKSAHREFHLFAAKILEEYQTGSKSTAKRMLAEQFNGYSGNVQRALVDLHKLAHGD